VVGVALGFVGIALAIVVPLFIEAQRRPSFRVERAEDGNERESPPYRRFVGIRVINETIPGWRGRWLLRNTATGCRVFTHIRSRSDGQTTRLMLRWSAAQRPLSMVIEDGNPWFRYDQTKVPQTLLLDVHPDPHGEHLTLALKTDGDTSAYGFSSLSWSRADWRFPEWELSDDVYDIAILVQTGTEKAAAFFVLHNEGDRHTGLRLTDSELAVREARALFGLPT
jgi:hypothetical protein